MLKFILKQIWHFSMLATLNHYTGILVVKEKIMEIWLLIHTKAAGLTGLRINSSRLLELIIVAPDPFVATNWLVRDLIIFIVSIIVQKVGHLLFLRLGRILRVPLPVRPVLLHIDLEDLSSVVITDPKHVRDLFKWQSTVLTKINHLQALLICDSDFSLVLHHSSVLEISHWDINY